MATSEWAAKVSVMGVCLDAASYQSLTDFIGALPEAVIIGNLDHYAAVEREVSRTLDVPHVERELGAAHALPNTRICFIDYDQHTEEAIRVTERLRSEYPDLRVFAVSSYTDSDRIIAAMRAGCSEYLSKPLRREQVLDGLTRIDAIQKKKARTRVRGKVITVVGAKGGTGVTTLALHLALGLAQDGKRNCVLVDLHRALGDATLYLGTGHHQYSFYELANESSRLDEELLQGFLIRHSSGLHILDSPDMVDETHGGRSSTLEHTFAFLADTYQFVIVDCPPALNEGTLASIAQSDQIAIIMTAELPAVRNSARYLDYLSKLGHTSNRIHVVLNRYSKKGPLSDDRIEKALGREISLRVPNSYNEVIQAINAGAPVSSEKKSEFAAAIQIWTHKLLTNGAGYDGIQALAPAKLPAETKWQIGGLRALFGK